MTMRIPVAKVASLLLAGIFVLSGCSLLPAADEADPEPSRTRAADDSGLSSTAWTKAARTKVAKGGTLRLGAAAMPRNFNPAHPDAVNSDAGRLLAPTVGGAVRITADGGWKVDRDYAESVEVTDKSPLTVKVRLNPRAVWQGGTSITARDMVAYWKASNGSDSAYEVASTAGYDDIDSVEAGKSRFDYTVTFKKPNAEWPLYVYPRLAANVSSSPKLFNSGFRTRAISSNGPFMVSSIDAAKGVVIEKPNPRWWGAPPRLVRITWQVAAPDLQAKAYAAGELDAVDLDASTYGAGKAAGGGSIERAAGVEWSQVTLNGGRGPLKDVGVRRAVAHAINRDAIAKRAAAELASPPAPLGSVILLPGQRGYVDSSAPVGYDPQQARALLDKAGWTEGADGIRARKGKRLTLTMPVPANTPSNSNRARLISADLKAVGVDVRLRSVPSAKFFTQYVIALDFDLVTFVRRGSPFPIGAAESLFYPVDSAQNFTGIGDDRIGKGWDVTTGTLDDALRLKRVAKLDEWLFDDVAVVPLAVTPIAIAVRSGVVNYGAAQFEQPDWTSVGFIRTK